MSQPAADPLEPTRDDRRAVRQRAFYRFCRSLVDVFMITVYRPITLHRDRLPAEGAVLLVANHQSLYDPPAIGRVVRPRACSFLARDTLYKGAFGALIVRLNTIPVNRDAADAASIRAVIRRLRVGAVLLLFPEGTRSPDGSVRPFKRGSALIIKRAGCPVMPVAVEGMQDVWPRSRKLPRLGGRWAVAFGEPIDPAELTAPGADTAMARLRDEVDALRTEARAALDERADPRRGEEKAKAAKKRNGGTGVPPVQEE